MGVEARLAYQLPHLGRVVDRVGEQDHAPPQGGPDLPGHLDLLRMVGPVDFRYQRLDYRWARRDLSHLQARAVLFTDGIYCLADALGNVVTLPGARVLRYQVHLNVRTVRALPQEVVTYQPVEVVRPGSTRVDLVIDDLGLLGDPARQFARHARCLLQCRAIRHVENDLHLALVVEGEHLHADDVQDRQHQRQGQQEHHRDKKRPPLRGILQEWHHDAAVKARGPAFLDFPALGG